MKVTITITVPDDPNDPKRIKMENNAALEILEDILEASGADYEWEDDSDLVTKEELHKFLWVDSGILPDRSRSDAKRVVDVIDAHFTLHRR